MITQAGESQPRVLLLASNNATSLGSPLAFRAVQAGLFLWVPVFPPPAAAPRPPAFRPTGQPPPQSEMALVEKIVVEWSTTVFQEFATGVKD